eukprot:SAG22_NODE_1108_length_5550_cov_4.655109_3_plen_179_part_00
MLGCPPSHCRPSPSLWCPGDRAEQKTAREGPRGQARGKGEGPPVRYVRGKRERGGGHLVVVQPAREVRAGSRRAQHPVGRAGVVDVVADHRRRRQDPQWRGRHARVDFAARPLRERLCRRREQTAVSRLLVTCRGTATRGATRGAGQHTLHSPAASAGWSSLLPHHVALRAERVDRAT